MAADRNTSIRRSQLKPIQYDDLDATNAAVDNYVPSYDEATGKFTWIAVAGGVTNLPDLVDVVFDSGTPTDNQVLTYDNASGKWKAEDPQAGLSGDNVDDFTIKFVDNKLKIADRIELNIMLNAFRIAVNGSLSQFGMVDGMSDEFEDESGIDTGASANEDYDSVNDLYKPTTVAGLELDYMEYATDGAAQAAYVSSDASGGYGSDVMTGGTASADRYNVGFEPALAVNDSTGAPGWVAAGNAPAWWKYDLGVAVTKTVRKLRIFVVYEYLKDFKLQGSNNDSDWDDIHTGQCANATQWNEFTFSNSTAYRYYKIDYQSNWNKADCAIVEIEMMEYTPDNLQCYSEASIKNQGSYSLKAVAVITDSLNDTLTNSGLSIDLTDIDELKIDFYASRTGTNIQLQIHDSGGTTSTKDIVISSADTWTEITWDVSGISNANKDDIDSIIIKIINADSANTFYVDNFYAAGIINNMTLISISFTAEAAPEDARIVLFEEDVDSITENTDLKAYVSRDGGSTYAQVTLVDEGDYASGKRILTGIVDLTQSGIGSGTNIEYKITTLNNKSLKLHCVGLHWD